ncbi:hypothetical protein B0A64_15025 [Flavobacterium araucananum]|uniref:Glycine-rich domain-containing protein n=2 Tax=Flavobacterium araucananum TaxID=946678 RepID=A0A227P3K5_9FLAO|nr:hypothetical protein B0A64_15025 [Flavobacterium araucananum]
MITYSWSQTTKTFGSSGTFAVPSGVTSISVQAWGGGGASGAPLLLGRGAAGGGGGAYASGPVSVTSGTTLNVVVASQTAGTTGTGTAGGNSTITGFESSILAAGGSGGAANNAGGTPVGGAGGTTAASAGTTKLAGGNGGNGNSWNLLGLLLSSGPGGAGANNGGVGGAAVSGLILSNAPGNAGSTPGGAGSGAINSALGAPYAGGAGAAGQVIISYTCPTYSITSTTATNVCSTSGTTSTVTLTSGAGALPVGNYVVTYNRSSPNATALTANVVVTTAGTGTFTATGLSTAGSSIITITKLTSETCSSNITTNNTATITIAPATVGGTVSGGTSICAGNTSGALTLSGNVGTVVKWQFAVSPFSTWTDVSNPTTANTYTSVPLTATTQFRAVITAICGTANSGTTTVTVNPVPTITLTENSIDICFQDNSSGTPITGVFEGLTGSPTTYSIVWNPSPVNNLVAITDDALSGNNFYFEVPAGLAVGTYTGTITVKNAAGCVSLGAPLIINIKESPTINSAGTINPILTSNTSQNATLVYSATTGNPDRYSIDWADNTFLADQPITLDSFSASGGALHSITISANVPAGTYTGTFFISNQNCERSYPISILIVDSAPTIALAAATENVCIFNNVTPEQTTLSYSATTGNPTTYSIAWVTSPTNNFVDVTDASLPSSPITIAVPSDTFTGTYTGTLTVKNSGGTVSSDYDFTVTVANTPGLYINGPAVISPLTTSSSAQIATLEYSQVTGALPETYNIDWDAAANTALLQDQPNTAWTFEPIGDIINTIAISANVPPGTYYGTMFLNTSTCTGSVPVSIVINDPAPTIELEPTTVDTCPGNTTTLYYNATTGNPTTYSIVWNSSPANNFVAVTDAAFPSSPISIAVPAGIYTGNLTVKNANGDVSTNSIFTVKVFQSAYIISTGTIDTITTSSSPQTATLQYSSTLGSPNKYGIDWDDNTFLGDQGVTLFPFSASGGALNTITISANVPPGTYTGTFFISNLTCQESFPISIVISNPVPTIDLGTSALDVCVYSGSNTNPQVLLGYSGTTGNPTTYSIAWSQSPPNGIFTVNNAALPLSPITITVPSSTAPGTYTGTLTVKNASGAVSSGSIFTLEVNQGPTISTTGTLNPITTSPVSQNATLIYNGATGNPTYYYTEWDSPLLANQNLTPYSFSSFGGILNSISISANAPAGTYTGTLTIFNSTCDKSYPISIVINPSSGKTTIAGASPNQIQSTSTTDSASAENPVVVSVLNKVIDINTFNQNIDKVFIYDVSGTLIYKKDSVENPSLVIDNLRSGNQVLVVKVLLKSSTSKTKKIIY